MGCLTQRQRLPWIVAERWKVEQERRCWRSSSRWWVVVAVAEVGCGLVVEGPQRLQE